MYTNQCSLKNISFMKHVLVSTHIYMYKYKKESKKTGLNTICLAYQKRNHTLIHHTHIDTYVILNMLNHRDFGI